MCSYATHSASNVVLPCVDTPCIHCLMLSSYVLILHEFSNPCISVFLTFVFKPRKTERNDSIRPLQNKCRSMPSYPSKYGHIMFMNMDITISIVVLSLDNVLYFRGISTSLHRLLIFSHGSDHGKSMSRETRLTFPTGNTRL